MLGIPKTFISVVLVLGCIAFFAMGCARKSSGGSSGGSAGSTPPTSPAGQFGKDVNGVHTPTAQGIAQQQNEEFHIIMREQQN